MLLQCTREVVIELCGGGNGLINPRVLAADSGSGCAPSRFDIRIVARTEARFSNPDMYPPALGKVYSKPGGGDDLTTKRFSLLTFS